MNPVKILYVCDPAKAETCRKSVCRQNPYSADPVCEWTGNPEWAKTDAAGNPIIDWENTLFLLKQDILREVPAAVPYEYIAVIERVKLLAMASLTINGFLILLSVIKFLTWTG